MPMMFSSFESPHNKKRQYKVKQPCGDKRFKRDKVSGVDNFGGTE
jgi:hypothetical protein